MLPLVARKVPRMKSAATVVALNGSSSNSFVPRPASAKGKRAPLGFSGRFVRVFPSEILIDDIEVNVTHVVTITALNVDAHSRRIKFTPPAKPEFDIFSTPSMPVASGLELVAQLSFIPRESKDYSDEIIVTCETDRIVIPVRARPPKPILKFEGLVQLGAQAVNRPAFAHFQIKNEGKVGCTVSFDLPSRSCFKITPSEASIGSCFESNNSLQFRIEFMSREVGAIRDLVPVSVNGLDHGYRLDLSANVCKMSLDFLSNSQHVAMETVAFGSLYYGQQRAVEGLLVNNSPDTVPWTVTSGSENSPIEPFSCEPASGTLKPYDRVPVRVAFAPNKSKQQKGWRHQELDALSQLQEYTVNVCFESKANECKAKVALSGTGVCHEASLSTSELLRFGETCTHVSRDIVVTLRNQHEQLPIEFSIPRIPHFRAKPATGRLLPLQSLPLIVSFVPTQMGIHEGGLSVNICNGVGTLKMSCIGTCTGEGSPRKLVGGLTATIEDFSIAPNFVEPAAFEMQLEQRKEFKRPALWDKYDVGDGGESLKKTQAWAASYNSAIRTVKQQDLTASVGDSRTRVTDIGKFESGRDMGMLPYGGLDSPRLALPKQKDAVFLKPDAGKSVIKPKTLIIDSDKSIAQKFKAAPSSQAERRACSALLVAQELLSIAVNPRVMDLGKVCVQSLATKSFCVSNGANAPILVSIETTSPLLAQSGPVSQVIPSGFIAGFDIKFLCDRVMQFKHTVTYTINGQHKFTFDVLADVVPVMLRINKSELNFAFGEHVPSHTMSETIMISNPGNNRAEFRCDSSGPFIVRPTKGTVEPFGTEDIIVEFNSATAQPHNEADLVVSIIGGQDVVVHAVGDLDAGKVMCKSKDAAFGVMGVGSTAVRPLVVKNIGDCPAFFSADCSASGITLEPASAVVAVNDQVEIQVVFKPQGQCKLDSNVKFTVRGGKGFTVPVTGDVKVPDLAVTQQAFDFGSANVGGSIRLPLTVENLGDLPVVLSLDLRKYPEFVPKIPADVLLESEASAAPGGGSTYTIQLAGLSKVHAELAFVPSKAGEHAFELPLSLLGLPPGPTLRRIVTASASRPQLKISSSSVSFGRCIVLNDFTMDTSYTQSVVITNCQENVLGWSVVLVGGDASPDNCAFFIPQDGDVGELAGGESATVQIEFKPREVRSYATRLLLYLNGNTNQAIFDQEVTGVSTFPSLRFDRLELMLPTVPLGVSSSAAATIYNDGFENLEIKFRLPPDSAIVQNFQVVFPKGNMVGVHTKELPIRVTATSTKAVSFTVNLEIMDDMGRVFVLPVSGTIDNSVLSTLPFCLQFPDGVALKASADQPILVTCEQGLCESISSADGLLFEAQRLVQPVISGPLLVWANVMMLNTPIKSWADLAHSGGKAIIEILESFTGKAVPGAGPTKKDAAASSKKDVSQAVLTTYTKMLDYLRSYGVPCSHVRPMLLLTWDDFSRLFVPSSPQGATEEALVAFLTKNHAVLHQAAWISLTLVIARTFIVGRVTLRAIRALPGVDRKLFDVMGKMDAMVVGSSVYTPSECALLLWMEYHVAQVFPGDRERLKDFEGCLRNGRVFAALIISHVPTLKDIKNVKAGDGEEVVKFNMKLVLEAFKFLHVHPSLMPEIQQMLAPHRVQMLLLCVYLFNTLPNFIPKATVNFTAKLSEPCSRSVELSNPSSRPIVYKLLLQGSEQYSCPVSELRLEAKAKSSLDLQYLPRFSHPCESLLFLLPAKVEGCAVPSVLVFKLLGQVTSYKISASAATQTRLYEPVTMNVNVTNPFGELCEFSISVMDDTAAVSKSDPQVPSDPKQKGGKGGKSGGGSVTSHAVLIKESFWPKKASCKLSAGEEAQIQVVFCPFRLQSHRCLLKFSDPVIGEFVVELTADVELPAPLENIKASFEVKSLLTKDVTLASKNAAVAKCNGVLVERYGADKAKQILKDMAEVGAVEYKVYFDSTFFSTNAPSVTIVPPRPAAGAKPVPGKGAAKDDAPEIKATGDPAKDNKLSIELRPKGPGVYTSNIILKSAVDVRVMTSEVLVNAQGLKANLELTTSARIAITQEIPIVNVTAKDWVVSCMLDGSAFNGPKELRVPAKGKGVYNLVFNPSVPGQFDGNLAMQNTTTGDKYNYGLKGIAEDPVAEDTVVINCKSRLRHRQTIKVPNISQGTSNYSVECDLFGVSGASSLQVPSGSKADYDFSVLLPRGGNYVGSITFKTSDGKYCWYVLQINAANPSPEGVIKVEAQARSAAAIDITVKNPVNSTVTLDVTLIGDGLMGDDVLVLEPQASAVYQIIYAPLAAASEKGSVLFFSDEIGEFVYELQLTATDAEPIVIPPMSAPVGLTVTSTVVLDNTTEKDLVLPWSSSLPLVFYAMNPGPISIPALTSCEFQLVYAPSTLLDVQSATVVVGSKTLGCEWTLLASGSGRAPEPMPLTQVSSAVGSFSNNSLVFVNPFDTPITIQPSLDAHGLPPGVFALLSKPKPLSLAPRGEAKIGYTFAPQRMADHEAMICIDADTPYGALQWMYEIQGMAESAQVHSRAAAHMILTGSFVTLLQVGSLGKISCKARKSVQKVVEVQLAGSDAPFDAPVEFEIVAPEQRHLVQSFLSVSLDDNLPAPPPGSLRFLLKLEPLCAFKAAVELAVNRPNLGRWRFKLDLVASDADPDDSIIIESSIGKTASVSFVLQGVADVQEAYRARLSAESSDAFSVAPAKGLLQVRAMSSLPARCLSHISQLILSQPLGSAGTRLTVSFTPTEYGCVYSGRVIVESGIMQWVYELRGTYPQYKKPEGAAKIESQASADLLATMTHAPRDFMKSNRSKIAQQSAANGIKDN